MTDTPTKLNQTHPETPRTSSRNIVNHIGGSNRPLVTPSFSFGLGFLPSFQFGSPRNLNLMSAFSPQRFFQISNNLNRVVGENNHRRKILVDFGDNDFNTFVVSKSPSVTNKSKSTMLLDSLTSNSKVANTQKVLEHDHEHENSHHDTDFQGSQLHMDSVHSHTSTVHTTDDNLDLWSLGYDNSHNQTTLTSIYEEISPLDTKIESKISQAHKKIQLASTNVLEDSKCSSVDDNESDKENHVAKKRKLWTGPTSCSPSNDLATQIDTIASPRSCRKSAAISESSTPKPAATMGWNSELDNILLSSYYKYKKFMDNQPADSSLPLHTSQDKVIFRMLQNKTNNKVNKTPQQMGKRLVQLLKAEVTEEARNTVATKTTATKISSKHLSSSPIVTSVLKSSPINDAIQSPITNTPEYNLLPREICISFNSVNLDPHFFSRYNKTSSYHRSENYVISREDLLDGVCSAMVPEMGNLFTALSQEQLPLLIANHAVSLKKENTTTPGSSTSPFTSTPLPRMASISENGGSFKSFIKIIARVNDSTTQKPCMLNWRCKTQIYNDNRVIFKSDDYINGYSIEIEKDKNDFEVQIPFVKNFWSGFLTFLSNGGDNSLDELYVTQIIYEGNEIDGFEIKANDLNYKVRGCLLHKFKPAHLPNEEAKFDIVKLIESKLGGGLAANEQRLSDIEDDNATVVAQSSPYKGSPKLESNLRIDTATTLHIGPGPSSAPIYDATVLNKYTIKQHELIKLRMQQGNGQPNRSSVDETQFQLLQQFAPNQLEQPVQPAQPQPQFQSQPPPGLVTCQSTGNIHQFLQQQNQQNRANSTGSVPTPVMAGAQMGPLPILGGLQEFNNGNPNGNFTGNVFQMQPQPQQQMPMAPGQMNQQGGSQFQPPQPPNGIAQSNFMVPNANGNMVPNFVGSQEQFLQMQMQNQHQRQMQMQMQMQNQHQQQMQHNMMQGQFNPQFHANGFQPPAPVPLQHHHQPQPQQFAPPQQPSFLSQGKAPHTNKPVQPGSRVHDQTQSSSEKKRSGSKQSSKSNRSTVDKPMEITFGPILEYDPSSQPGVSSRNTASRPLENGLYRLPLNTQVSLYKPKKRQ